jgi:hypothetical protein
MPQHSHIIDLEVPEYFPRAPLERFHDAVLSHRQSYKAEWGHWAGGCNGFHYRFLACADVDEAFRTSIGSAGPSPPPPERARQELAVWVGDEYVRFREGLLGGDPPEVCRGCSLYRGVF